MSKNIAIRLQFLYKKRQAPMPHNQAPCVFLDIQIHPHALLRDTINVITASKLFAFSLLQVIDHLSELCCRFLCHFYSHITVLVSKHPSHSLLSLFWVTSILVFLSDFFLVLLHFFMQCFFLFCFVYFLLQLAFLNNSWFYRCPSP